MFEHGFELSLDKLYTEINLLGIIEFLITKFYLIIFYKAIKIKNTWK